MTQFTQLLNEINDNKQYNELYCRIEAKRSSESKKYLHLLFIINRLTGLSPLKSIEKILSKIIYNANGFELSLEILKIFLKLEGTEHRFHT